MQINTKAGKDKEKKEKNPTHSLKDILLQQGCYYQHLDLRLKANHIMSVTAVSQLFWTLGMFRLNVEKLLRHTYQTLLDSSFLFKVIL